MHSNTVLLRAGFAGRRVTVAMDMTGSMVGYLLSIEPDHLLLLAAFREPIQAEQRDRVTWSLAIVPRRYPIVVGSGTLSEESEEVQALHAAYGGKAFATQCGDQAGLPRDTEPDDVL